VPVKSLLALVAAIAPLPASSVTEPAVTRAAYVWLPVVVTFWMLAVLPVSETLASGVEPPRAPTTMSPPPAVIASG
jgi:hypothetical protein